MFSIKRVFQPKSNPIFLGQGFNLCGLICRRESTQSSEQRFGVGYPFVFQPIGERICPIQQVIDKPLPALRSRTIGNYV
jgi:hypothetical protein